MWSVRSRETKCGEAGLLGKSSQRQSAPGDLLERHSVRIFHDEREFSGGSSTLFRPPGIDGLARLHGAGRGSELEWHGGWIGHASGCQQNGPRPVRVVEEHAADERQLAAISRRECGCVVNAVRLLRGALGIDDSNIGADWIERRKIICPRACTGTVASGMRPAASEAA